MVNKNKKGCSKNVFECNYRCIFSLTYLQVLYEMSGSYLEQDITSSKVVNISALPDIKIDIVASDGVVYAAT